MEDIKYWIWLSRIEEITAFKKLNLINRFREPKDIFNMSKERLIENGISEEISKLLLKNEYRNNLDEFVDYMQKHNIKAITLKDDDYPEKLRNIYDPPIVIYAKGNTKILNDYGLAIIGCRNSSLYGEVVAEKIAYNIGKDNINVISGLARGIDSFAHIGALKANAKTIAVLGNGLNMIYPKENKYLADKIIGSRGSSYF